MNKQEPTRKLRVRPVAKVVTKAMERPNEDVLTVKRIGATLLVLGAVALGMASLINFLL